MTGEVIKSFLVGLGFDVDEKDLKNFTKGLANATLKVTGFYGATVAAATGVVAAIAKVSEGFEELGYEYRIIAPAINKTLVLRQELLKAYSAAGINITKVVLASVKLNMSLTRTKFVLEALYKSVASRFFEVLTKQSDLFRQRIYANLPKIQAVLEKAIKFIFKLLDATTQLALRTWSILLRVVDFFVMLDAATDGWSTKILALVAAWKLLNLSFLLTPLGAVIAALGTLLLLWDDFKTFQEGGTTLFNWEPAIRTTKQLITEFENIWDWIKRLGTAWNEFWGRRNEDGFAKSAQLRGVLAEPFQALGAWGANPAVANNLAGFRDGGAPRSAFPIGGIPSGPQNVTLNQNTGITVNSTADAAAVGKATANEQGRVNSDGSRNLQAAVKR